MNSKTIKSIMSCYEAKYLWKAKPNDKDNAKREKYKDEDGFVKRRPNDKTDWKKELTAACLIPKHNDDKVSLRDAMKHQIITLQNTVEELSDSNCLSVRTEADLAIEKIRVKCCNKINEIDGSLQDTLNQLKSSKAKVSESEADNAKLKKKIDELHYVLEKYINTTPDQIQFLPKYENYSYAPLGLAKLQACFKEYRISKIHNGVIPVPEVLSNKITTDFIKQYDIKIDYKNGYSKLVTNLLSSQASRKNFYKKEQDVLIKNRTTALEAMSGDSVEYKNSYKALKELKAVKSKTDSKTVNEFVVERLKELIRQDEVVADKYIC